MLSGDTWPWGCCSREIGPCEVHLSASETTVYLADPLRAELERVVEARGLTLKQAVLEALRARLDVARS